MDRTVYVTITACIAVNVKGDVDILEVIEEMDYDFRSQTFGAKIVDTDILDFAVTQSEPA